MKTFKSLPALTIIFSSLILIGAGHGGGFLLLIEIGWLPRLYGIGTKYFSLSLNSSYENSLGAAAMIAFIGHIVMIISLLFKRHKIKYWIQNIGIIILWLAFIYIIHDIPNLLSIIGLITGTPFLYVSGRLFRRNISRMLNPIHES